MSITVTKVSTHMRTYQAADWLADLAGEGGDEIFIGIGRAYPWSGNDTIIPLIGDSVDSRNQVFRELVAYKNIFLNNSCLVVPRADWSNGTTYFAYANSAQIYTYELTSNVNGTVTFSNTTVVG